MSTYAPLPGRVTAADIERAQYNVAILKSRATRLRKAVRRAAWQTRLLAWQVWLLRTMLEWRRAFDVYLSRVGAACIAMTVGAVAFVIGAHSLAATALGYLVAICSGVLITGAACLVIGFFPADDRLRVLQISRAARLPAMISEREVLRLELAQQEEALSRAQAEHDRLLAVVRSARHKLHTTRWQLMRGTDFEMFLADVFRELGYNVVPTGKSGDQGVDLVVSRNGINVAVQAKGYPSSTVGNSAVQEAHAGKAHYRCHASAVITNSRFTSSAKELAMSVQCILIDGSQIPDVIDGRISLIPDR